MAEERVNMQLRLPKDLRERIGELASQNDRSSTAEIVHRLQKSIEAEDKQRRPA